MYINSLIHSILFSMNSSQPGNWYKRCKRIEKNFGEKDIRNLFEFTESENSYFSFRKEWFIFSILIARFSPELNHMVKTGFQICKWNSADLKNAVQQPKLIIGNGVNKCS